MPSVKNAPDSRNIDATFAQCLQRILYFEKSDEEKSVRAFADWCNENGYGPIKDRAIYEILSGRSKPSATFILAVLTHFNDIELHAMFTVDKSIKTGAAEALRTASDMLRATAERLEGKK